jgi:hypothetical protein
MSFVNKLRDATLKVKAGELYYHYKNKRKFYRVERIGINEVDCKIVVVYTSCDHEKITWIRPLDSWLETIDGVPRFTLRE